MYGDIHLVILLVDDADDLLISLRNGAVGIFCCSWHSDKTCKLTNTKIYMHNEVTRLHLLQLLHGESHLTPLGTLALKLVFVEALEYLVVGKEDHLHAVIDISLVNGSLNRGRKGGGDNRVFENLRKTFLLLVAVGQNVGLVSLYLIFVYGLSQQFEILVEQRLRLAGERNIC